MTLGPRPQHHGCWVYCSLCTIQDRWPLPEFVQFSKTGVWSFPVAWLDDHFHDTLLADTGRGKGLRQEQGHCNDAKESRLKRVVPGQVHRGHLLVHLTRTLPAEPKWVFIEWLCAKSVGHTPGDHIPREQFWAVNVIWHTWQEYSMRTWGFQ